MSKKEMEAEFKVFKILLGTKSYILIQYDEQTSKAGSIMDVEDYEEGIIKKGTFYSDDSGLVYQKGIVVGNHSDIIICERLKLNS